MKKLAFIILIVPSVLLGCGQAEDPATTTLKLRIAELSAEETLLRDQQRTIEARLKELEIQLKKFREAEQVVTRK